MRGFAPDLACLSDLLYVVGVCHLQWFPSACHIPFSAVCSDPYSAASLCLSVLRCVLRSLVSLVAAIDRSFQFPPSRWISGSAPLASEDKTETFRCCPRSSQKRTSAPLASTNRSVRAEQQVTAFDGALGPRARTGNVAQSPPCMSGGTRPPSQQSARKFEQFHSSDCCES
jgi:hypothetical protein